MRGGLAPMEGVALAAFHMEQATLDASRASAAPASSSYLKPGKKEKGENDGDDEAATGENAAVKKKVWTKGGSKQAAGP